MLRMISRQRFGRWHSQQAVSVVWVTHLQDMQSCECQSTYTTSLFA